VKLRFPLLLSALAALTSTACATQQGRFEWGSYEPSLYRYTVHPDAREGYRTALVNAIEAGRRTNRVAPGLLAELGFLMLEDGRSVEANACFDEEMQRFPESRTFLHGVIERRKAALKSSKDS
jgi:hypothetical protein